jgi:Tripartite tricarboxylate transporter TctB family
MNQHLARGILLSIIALAFGLGALRYSLGSLVHAGPGLFPLLLSIVLFLLALVTIVQSRFLEAEPLYFNVKNIVLIMVALGGFVVLSKYVAMIAGIAFLVFVASLAGSSHSWKRSLQVTLALIVVAFLFQKFLGLNLKVM